MNPRLLELQPSPMPIRMNEFVQFLQRVIRLRFFKQKCLIIFNQNFSKIFQLYASVGTQHNSRFIFYACSTLRIPKRTAHKTKSKNYSKLNSCKRISFVNIPRPIILVYDSNFFCCCGKLLFFFRRGLESLCIIRLQSNNDKWYQNFSAR